MSCAVVAVVFVAVAVARGLVLRLAGRPVFWAFLAQVTGLHGRIGTLRDQIYEARQDLEEGERKCRKIEVRPREKACWLAGWLDGWMAG